MSFLTMPINGKADAEVFLKQLAKSPFQYHIDDDPRDIFTIPRTEADRLSIQMDLVCTYLTDAERWEIYGEAVGV
jgi:hypothetical protein